MMTLEFDRDRRRDLQGELSVDFIDGHNSEVTDETFYGDTRKKMMVETGWGLE